MAVANISAPCRPRRSPTACIAADVGRAIPRPDASSSVARSPAIQPSPTRARSDLPGRTVATSRGGRWRRIGWKRGILIITGAVVRADGRLAVPRLPLVLERDRQRERPAEPKDAGGAGAGRQHPDLAPDLASSSAPTAGARSRTAATGRTRSCWCAPTPATSWYRCSRSPATCTSRSPGTARTRSTRPTPTAGPPLPIQTVNNLTGLKVNHVVLVDFSGFEELIDSLGGVRSTTPTRSCRRSRSTASTGTSTRAGSTWRAAGAGLRADPPHHEPA